MSAHMASIITYITLTQSDFYYYIKVFSNIKGNNTYYWLFLTSLPIFWVY